ncbi:T9SS type A sorting domain-containing protein [Chryseobacterium gwangjuense]|uniref:T9SS type A sorting domain-containing protein n=1 Tax=Chryseobacterium gwangjuense TaxID=1069980 RepID=UPI001E4AC206|nr:T9SS type A sorting domain-containing protein [Chryseobacterium gwangjuense]MCE3076391.1 T9SS type A sorting domain-containing protein [Chryseobacterium gwangjuense]
MKKLLFFIVLTYIPIFSQSANACDYVFSPPYSPNTSMAVSAVNNVIHAIDLNLDNGTTANFDSAEFEVRLITPSIVEPVNQAKIYLYQDQNGVPGNLISNFDVIPSSVISIGNSGQYGYYYKVTIPLSFSLVGSNFGGKVWFGYQLKTANNQNVYQEMFLKTDADGVSKFYNNAWHSSNEETKLTIFKNCTLSALATNDLGNNPASKELKIYPNPTTGNVFFNYKNVKSIEVFNLNGAKIDIEMFEDRVDLSQLPNGVYIIKYMLKDGQIFNKKVIKY